MFLTDKPEGIDLFESKSHDRIADSMISVIKGNKDEHDIIGLEGGWGSGKSNIIEIMKKKMVKSHSFFIYNAWGHQEDLQRRAFLEELTEKLIECESLKKPEKWKKYLESLLARKVRKTTKTIPSFSRGYLWIAAIIFLTSITRSISFPIPESVDCTFWASFLKILLENFPVLLSIILYPIVIIVISIKNKDKFKNTFNEYLDRIFALYKNKELKDTVETITSTKEPTVKEFEKWMRDLSDDLKKDIVIVFDNMDRLPADKAKDLWSSIHTFFSESHYEKISVIVPFDRKHIRKIYEPSTSNDSEYHDADRFIDKTFSLLYRVSPPVISDWKNYFTDKFNEINLDSKELIEVRNLYDYKFKRIIPREIIKFLNELSLIAKMWDKEIPLKYIALYILNKDAFDVENPSEAIIKNEYLKDTGDLFNGDVQKYLSALVYNVPLDTAVQVLLEREIIDSIRNRSTKEFMKLTEVKGFDFVFESNLRNIENIDETTYIIFNTLYKNDLYPKTLEIAIKSITNKFQKTEIKEIDFKEYMKQIIIMNSNKTRLLDRILKSFGSLSEIDGGDYYIAINKIEKFVNDNKLNYNVYDNLMSVNLSINDYFKFINKAKDNPQKYKVFTNINDLETDINTMIDSNVFDCGKIELLSYIDVSEGFSSVKASIKSILEDDKINMSNLSGIVNLANTFSEIPTNYNWDFTKTYTNLLQEFNKDDVNTYILVAMFIRHIFDGNAPHAHIDVVNQKLINIDEVFIMNVIKYVKIFMDYDDVLITTTKSNLHITKDIAKDFDNAEEKRLDIKEILTNFDGIVDALEETEEYLIEKLDPWGKFINENINRENIFEVLDSSRFIVNGLETSFKIVDNVCNIYLEYYCQQDISYFLELFDDYDSVEFEVFVLLIAKSKLELTNSISMAYKEYLVSAVDNGEINDNVKELMNEIYDTIEKRTILTSLRNIRDDFINNKDIMESDVCFYLPLLFKHGKLEARPGDVTRKILIPVLKDDKFKDLIYDNKEKSLKIINSSNEEKLDVISILKEYGDEIILPMIKVKK